MSTPDFAPLLSAPDLLAAPELGLDGIVNKHNAVVSKVSHVIETVTHPLAKLAVQVRVRGVQSPNSVSGAQKRVYRLNAPFILSLRMLGRGSGSGWPMRHG